MLFGKSSGAAVPFGEATRAGFNREASRFESLIERKPRAIHNGGVFEWCSAAFLHTRERLWPVAQKVFERLVPFRLVTGMAGDHQIGDPIAPPATLWQDMIDFQGHSCGQAIRTMMSPLREQILA